MGKMYDPDQYADQDILARAKKEAKKQKPDDEWALINHIYQKMGGKYRTRQKKKMSKADNPFIALGQLIMNKVK